MVQPEINKWKGFIWRHNLLMELTNIGGITRVIGGTSSREDGGCIVKHGI